MKKLGIFIFILYTLIGCLPEKQNTSPPVNLASLKEDSCVPEKYKKILDLLPFSNINLNDLPWYAPEWLLERQLCRDEYLNKTLPSKEDTGCRKKTYEDLQSLYQQLNSFCQS